MCNTAVVPSMNLVLSIFYLAMLRCGCPAFLSEVLAAVNQGKVLVKPPLPPPSFVHCLNLSCLLVVTMDELHGPAPKDYSRQSQHLTDIFPEVPNIHSLS